MADLPSNPLPALAAPLVDIEVPAECVPGVAAALALLRDHAQRVETFFVENPDAA